ncbi:MAG: molybdopterin-dependent oxidoreductase [Alphaproteobacteria bacterium]|nr:molybdopterin-dependent oxidoreductase [Alphaproteobacteria bacterium]
MTDTAPITGSHWGVFRVGIGADGAPVVLPNPKDPDPSPLAGSFLDAARDMGTRTLRPMVRKGWLEGGPKGTGAGRGAEPFVALPWDEMLDLVAAEVDRVRTEHGNESIYAGSYGWASAGRLHFAQGTLKRFLGLAGGFTNSVGNYSFGAASVLVPHIVGNGQSVQGPLTSWSSIVEHTTLLVSFGGVPLKNTQINHGGLPEHDDRGWQDRIVEAGVKVVCISPLRDDVAGLHGAEWIAPRPNTDTALMLGIAHTLIAEGLHDTAFLARYCTGFDIFRAYVTGEADGVTKDAAWAAAITQVDAEIIRALARRMAEARTLITACWSIQRADHGEQPYWMAITLAAMLGQIGLPGGGYGFGYGAVGGVGTPRARAVTPRLPVGPNPVRNFIPVARIADMLLDPGGSCEYDGKRVEYPDVRLVWWAGGNPFHHHQDINRLLEGWRRVDTVIVNDPWWTPCARHADIVLPSTTTLERDDIGAATVPAMLFAMQKCMDPPGEARNDLDIFAALSDRMGFGAAYTEGRDESGWLRHLYDVARQQNAEAGVEMPDFDAFWEAGTFEFPRPENPVVLFDSFRADPIAAPLKTPSGKIEIFSETIAGFGYDDCPGHPAWLEPAEWLGGAKATTWPLHLVSNQPRTRLHGQLDSGPVSRDSKISGREPVWMHPDDAAARGLVAGDVVRLFNDRGACLAGLVPTGDIRPGVVMLATGAWYDPLEPGAKDTLDIHGNPNMLTLDKGTSRLSQAPISQTALVEVEKWSGPLPDITVFRQPEHA